MGNVPSSFKLTLIKVNAAPEEWVLVGHVSDEVAEVLLVHGLGEVVEDEEVGVAHLAHHLLHVLAVHVATQEATRLQLYESVERHLMRLAKDMGHN